MFCEDSRSRRRPCGLLQLRSGIPGSSSAQIDNAACFSPDWIPVHPRGPTEDSLTQSRLRERMERGPHSSEVQGRVRTGGRERQDGLRAALFPLSTFSFCISCAFHPSGHRSTLLQDRAGRVTWRGWLPEELVNLLHLVEK